MSEHYAVCRAAALDLLRERYSDLLQHFVSRGFLDIHSGVVKRWTDLGSQLDTSKIETFTLIFCHT